MRTLFTSYDIKEIIRQIFNGNLELHKATNVEYENPNSEKILLIDEDNGTQTQKDLAEYLNVKFYSWKNRLIEKSEHSLTDEPVLTVFDDWVQSLNFSMNESYALVELIDEEVTASQDIDSATKIGRITFLIQADKITNLDYYLAKIRNSYLGNPQDIQNSYGDIVKAYITIGTLLYDEEPSTIQLGECVVVSCNFRISYLTDALSYNDTQIEISLDGDDTYDENGEIVGETKYLTMPLTKITWQNIFTSTPLPTAERPDLTGFVATSLSNVKTLTFYDFNKDLSMKFNDLFWKCGCYKYDGTLTTVQDVNIPVYIRIKSNGHSYVFKDMVDQMQKVITNNDFNISSITLKGWGKFDGENANTYLLSFDSNGGTSYQSRIVTYGQSIGILPTPYKNGHDFIGWYIDDTEILSNDIWAFNQSKTAVAHWQPLTYTLTFYSENGSEPTTKSVTYGQSIGELPTPSKVGYTFSDWTINGEIINSSTIWFYNEDKSALANYTLNIYQTLTIGTNVRNKQIKLQLYTGTNDLGDSIFTFENNSTDYISGEEGQVGFWGYGIFSEIQLVGEYESGTYEIVIPNDKDYIVETLAEGYGIEQADYRE